MKSPPFKTSDLKDEYYNKLANNEKGQFWDIFSGKCKPSIEFKGIFSYILRSHRETIKSQSKRSYNSIGNMQASLVYGRNNIKNGV